MEVPQDVLKNDVPRNVVALAGGIGGGKFLRGLVRVVEPANVTAIVNTGDDLWMHGLRICPDLDSVTYWLGDAFDRERGWGRRGESFRATEELRAFDPDAAWFGLGDLDLATHLYRTGSLADGMSLSDVTTRIASRFAIGATIVPMTEDEVATRVHVLATGEDLDLHFQEYWVQRGGQDEVKSVRVQGIEDARPSPGVIEAIEQADAIVFAPSNPVVSIGPILAVPGIRSALAARRPTVAGVSGILGGAPVAGMADRLMPSAGMEVTAAGVADSYRDVLAGWVIDERDRDLATRIEAESGMQVIVTDTVMHDDDDAARVARAALDLAIG
jgi:LPPG:FO 2-phospho-L-lactate transferase